MPPDSGITFVEEGDLVVLSPHLRVPFKSFFRQHVNRLAGHSQLFYVPRMNLYQDLVKELVWKTKKRKHLVRGLVNNVGVRAKIVRYLEMNVVRCSNVRKE